MLYVKMMSNENLPDTHPNKGFKLIQIADLEELDFFRIDNTEFSGDFNLSNPFTMRISRDGETKEQFALTGNVYVMNMAGKTIATYSC